MATIQQSMASPVVNTSCVWTMLIITLSVTATTTTTTTTRTTTRSLRLELRDVGVEGAQA